MQRRGRAVEADIGGDAAGLGERVEVVGLGDLVDEPPAGEHAQEIGLVNAHGNLLRDRPEPSRRPGRWCNRSPVRFKGNPGQP